jgi:hypothetical protein
MVKPSIEIAEIQNNLIYLLEGYQNNSDLSDTRIFLNKHTLRLTPIGYKLFKTYYTFWEFEHPPNKAGQLIELLKKMKAPYYTNNKRLVLFTEQDAFMCKLAGTDGWVNSKG